MAIREYIGARYVPIFSEVNGGVWNNSYTYEPLTIVKYGTDWYTSKKAVPTGAAITDTSYWVKTGDYNGAIATLDAKIDTKLDKLNNRKFLFLGDSWDTATDDGWIDPCAASLGITNYKRVSAGGYGFEPEGGNAGKTFERLVQNNITTIGTDVTDIVICGGTNDKTQTAANLYTAGYNFMEYVKSVFPNLQKVYLGMTGYGIQATEEERLKYDNVRLYYQEIARRYGYTYMGNSHYVMYDPRYFEDGLDNSHPNNTGTVNMGRQIAECILGGSCEVDFKFVATAELFTTNFSADPETMNIAFHFRNGLLTAYSDGKAQRTLVDMTSNLTWMSVPKYNCPLRAYQPTLVAGLYGGSPYSIDNFVLDTDPNALTRLKLRSISTNIVANTAVNIRAFNMILNL